MTTLLQKNSLEGRSLISIRDLSRMEIEYLLQLAAQQKANPDFLPLKNKILGICFHEASTRTRLSFTSAMLRLGGQTLGYSEATSTSQEKGESLADTIRMMEGYCDAIVLRHPKQGAARLAADLTNIPVINAGDGAHEHPTQTLIDLFSMQECQGHLDELNIALVGDLRYARTVHSLALVAPLFRHRLYLVSPPSLEMPSEICRELSEGGIRYSMHRKIEEVIDKVDILYLTRIQKERLASEADRTTLSQYYRLTPQLLERTKPHVKVLHPLPRVDEIDPKCDALPQAFYFEQAANSVAVRQALLSKIL